MDDLPIKVGGCSESLCRWFPERFLIELSRAYNFDSPWLPCSKQILKGVIVQGCVLETVVGLYHADIYSSLAFLVPDLVITVHPRHAET